MEKGKKNLSKKVSEVGIEEFLDIVLANLKERMPDEYQGMKLEQVNVKKVNVSKIGLQFVPSTIEAGIELWPVLYVDEIYEYFKKIDITLDTALNFLAGQFISAMDDAPISATDLMSNFNEDFVKERVVCVLVNADANEAMLENLPHRNMNDLAVIYVVLLDDSGTATIKINNTLAAKFDLSEEQLYNIALENTRKHAVVCSLSDIMEEKMGGGKKSSPDDEVPFYFIGNSMNILGASTVLLENKLYELAEKLNSDLYLIPASIHEMLAIPSEMSSPFSIASQVILTNATQVAPEERLSNSVYLYSRGTRKVSMAVKVDANIAKS